MKTLKKLLLVSVILLSLRSSGQVTLQHIFPGSAYTATNLQWTYLKYSGFKYVRVTAGGDSLILYNLNYSLFKSFLFPGSMKATADYVLWYVSESLFDNDSTHIEYIMEDGLDTIRICKESSILYSFDSLNFGASFNGYGAIVSSPIVTTDSGTFMLTENGYSDRFQVYKLGGSLPCMPTCLGGGPPLSAETFQNGNSGSSRIYPNPATTYTDIYYTLPPGTTTGEVVLYDLVGKEMKRYTVDTHFTHLHITTSDVSAGTYIYQLIAGGRSVSSKKIIVVK